VSKYLDGMVTEGFTGIHQMKYYTWQIIDGIHFLSITLTGYKLPEAPAVNGIRFATLRGPFSRLVDEQGQAFQRGAASAIDARTATRLQTPPSADLFVLSETPVSLTKADPRFLCVPPEQASCVWKGDFAILTGPFAEAADDDNHVYVRGVPLEVCSKTMRVLETPGYSRHFSFINRAQSGVSGTVVSCESSPNCC
jgi:hypothetical protein